MFLLADFHFQSIWAYWQDSEELLNKTVPNQDITLTYLDHFLTCTK